MEPVLVVLVIFKCRIGQLPYFRDEALVVSLFLCAPSSQIVQSLNHVSVLHGGPHADLLLSNHYCACIAANHLL